MSRSGHIRLLTKSVTKSGPLRMVAGMLLGVAVIWLGARASAASIDMIGSSIFGGNSVPRHSWFFISGDVFIATSTSADDIANAMGRSGFSGTDCGWFGCSKYPRTVRDRKGFARVQLGYRFKKKTQVAIRLGTEAKHGVEGYGDETVGPKGANVSSFIREDVRVETRTVMVDRVIVQAVSASEPQIEVLLGVGIDRHRVRVYRPRGYGMETTDVDGWRWRFTTQRYLARGVTIFLSFERSYARPVEVAATTFQDRAGQTRVLGGHTIGVAQWGLALGVGMNF